MAKGRFFILDETCPASEIPHMMGRVVADKLLPLHRYAPVEPLLTSRERRHNPQDIIPGILPRPSSSINRRDVVSSATDARIKIFLTSFFGFNMAKGNKERIELESQEVRRYTLNNSDQYFTRLMEDDLYARDVQDLLANMSSGRAYLVIGFLTTTGTVWTRSGSKTISGGLDVTIPVAELAGAPTMGILDPRIAPSRATTTTREHKLKVAEEEIFAVAYSVVKSSVSFDPTAPLYMRKKLVLGQPKRAGAKHLAMSADSDDEIDEEDASLVLEPLNENEEGALDLGGFVEIDFDSVAR